jgi:hypothetical protein
MDVLKGANRNGLDGAFFNFIPPPLIGAAVGGSAIQKSRQRKFKNEKAADLSIKYPHKLTSDEQDEIIAKVSEEQRKLVEEKNNSRGSKRAKLNSQLKGYDEYLNDLRLVRDELLSKEKEAISKLKEKTQQVTTLEEVTKQDDVIQSAIKENNQVESTNVPKKSNTLLYVAIGAVVVLGIILINRKK